MVEQNAHKGSTEKGLEIAENAGRFNSDSLGAKLARENPIGQPELKSGLPNTAEKVLPNFSLTDDKQAGGVKIEHRSEGKPSGHGGGEAPAGENNNTPRDNKPHGSDKAGNNAPRRVDNMGKPIEPGDANQNPDRLDPNKNINASDIYKNLGKLDSNEADKHNKQFDQNMKQYADQMDPNKNFGQGMKQFADQMDPTKNFGQGMKQVADQMDPTKNFGQGMKKYADQLEPDKKFDPEAVRRAVEQLGKQPSFDPRVLDQPAWEAAQKAH